MYNYACLLDATKAFDCVRYDKLFELLLKKGHTWYCYKVTT